MGICGLGYLELRQDEREEKNTSGVQTRARKRAKTVKMSDTSEEPYPYLLLENIPSLLTVHNILTRLSPEDLCTFARCSRANKTLVSGNDAILWGPIVHKEWGSDPLVSAAVGIAGTHKAYAMQKRLTAVRPLGPNGDGWKRPCEYDLRAMQERVLAAARLHQQSEGSGESTPPASPQTPANGAAARLYQQQSEGRSGGSTPPAASIQTPANVTAATQRHQLQQQPSPPSAHVLFLLDGSGSVGDEEFSASTTFIVQVTAALKAQSNCKVAVAQFSTDVRTEWEDTPGSEVDLPAFESTIKSMVRINGGTNIAAAYSHAGKMFKKLDREPTTPKVVILLTDGRVDTYQSKEAQQVVIMLADEHPNTTLFAFGVGRGIDRAECIAMIEAGRPAHGCKFPKGSERYIDLFYKDDGPW